MDVDGTAALLEPCLEAIAAGDGRHTWWIPMRADFSRDVRIQCQPERCSVVRDGDCVEGLWHCRFSRVEYPKVSCGSSRRPGPFRVPWVTSACRPLGTACRFLPVPMRLRGSSPRPAS